MATPKRSVTAAAADVVAMPSPSPDGGLLARLLEAPALGQRMPAGQILTGHLDGVDNEGRLLFVAESGSGAAVPVAIGLALSDGVLVGAARNRQRALVVQTQDAPPRLVLVGLVRERVSAKSRDAAPGHLEVVVDGETVQFTAERQIELRCGKASLLLRKDGKVVLSGTHVISTSQGPNKIKGATIALN